MRRGHCVSLPLPSSSPGLVCPSPTVVRSLPSPAFSIQHGYSSTSCHRPSFVCALSQRLSLVKEAARCQVPPPYSSTARPQRHRSEPDFSFLPFVSVFVYLIRYESETKEERASEFAINTWAWGFGETGVGRSFRSSAQLRSDPINMFRLKNPTHLTGCVPEHGQSQSANRVISVFPFPLFSARDHVS